MGGKNSILNVHQSALTAREDVCIIIRVSCVIQNCSAHQLWFWVNFLHWIIEFVSFVEQYKYDKVSDDNSFSLALPSTPTNEIEC